MKAERRTTAGRHGAQARLAETRLRPALELRGDLVPPRRPAGAAVDEPVVVEAEGQQHRLLQPLVDLPRIRPRRARDFLGDPRLAGIHEIERLFDRVAHVARRLRRDLRAILEGAFDQRLKFRVGHAGSLDFGGARVSPRRGGLSMRRPTLKPSWRRTALFREARFECLSRKARRRGKRESSAHTLLYLPLRASQPAKQAAKHIFEVT